MTNEEAIKYLRQIYPNGAGTWLDEQRTEAIGMAIEALSKISDQEEPECEDLEEEIARYFVDKFGFQRHGEVLEIDNLSIHVDDLLHIARHFANWQREQDDLLIRLAKVHYRLLGEVQMKKQMMEEAVEGKITEIHNDTVMAKSDFFSTQKTGLFVGDKVKLIIVKED